MGCMHPTLETTAKLFCLLLWADPFCNLYFPNQKCGNSFGSGLLSSNANWLKGCLLDERGKPLQGEVRVFYYGRGVEKRV